MNRRASKRSLIFNACVAAVLVLLSAAPASAQSAADKKRAQELQVAGVRLLDQGDNRGALKKFEEAIRIFPSPKILFNMGRAHAAMGSDVEAVNEFERFLDEAPYAPKQSRDEAEKIVQGLRPRLSYVEIGTDDVGSRISVDGREVGLAPLARPLAISPGAHELRVEKADMLTETRSVSPVAGQKVRVFVKLRPLAASKPVVVAPPPPPPPPTGRGDGSPARDGTDTPQPPPPPEQIHAPDVELAASGGSGSGRRSLKWIAWGAALAGGGIGVYGTLRNSSLVKDFDSGCGFVDGVATGAPPGNKAPAQCVSLKNQYESAARLGIAGFIGAGVLAAAGVVLWATESSPREGHTTLAACVPGVSAALAPSMTCAFRF